MDEREKILLIEKLITDEEFYNLKNYFKDINIFKVMGINQKEIKHSNTIAWLLDPFASHNLGALFFQKFMSQLFEKDPDYFNDRFNDSNINILHLLLNDIDDMKVFREKENIDILVVSKKLKIVFCIENKINAGINNEQLDKYYKYINEHYSSFSKFFLLLSPAGYEVPVDKSENPEDWISASYEDIVKILRSILKLYLEQKVRYIIGDYVKFLEKENIVGNVELDGILSSLCAKHKDAIDLLLNYQKSQPVINRVREIFKETFQDYEKQGKIVCKKSTIDSFWFFFSTTNMNKYFPPDQNRQGSWKFDVEAKYQYWVNLNERTCPPPRIVLQLGPLGQDDDTIRKMDLIRKKINPTKKKWSGQYNLIKVWDINIDWTLDSLEDLNDEHMKAEIRKTLDEILLWEETEIKNILK